MTATTSPGGPEQVPGLIVRICREVLVFEWFWLALILPLALFPEGWRILALLLLPVLWAMRRIGFGYFVPATSLDIPILGLLIMLLVSLLITFDLAASLPKAAGLVYGVALYYAVVAAAERDSRNFLWALLFFMLAGLAVTMLGLLSISWSSNKLPLIGGIIARLPQRLITLPEAAGGVNPNQLAGTLLWLVPPAAALAVITFGRSFRPLLKEIYIWPVRILSAGLALFLGLVLLLTQSRSALLGVAAAGLFVFLVALHRRPRLLWAVIFLVIAAGLLLFLTLDREQLTFLFFESASGDLSGSTAINSFEGRSEIWLRALYGIRDFPLTGLGIGAFRRAVPILYPFIGFGQEFDIAHAHNHLLQTALDLGLPGLAAYLALWITAAVMLWKGWIGRQEAWFRTLFLGFAAALLAYALFGISDTLALGAKPGFIFWFLLGLISAAYRH